MGIEVHVHRQLLALLRAELVPAAWPHQLTMGRLVARALAQGRPTLIQVSGSGEHRLSYLLPALAIDGPVILCASEATRQQWLATDLPLLRRHVDIDKPIEVGDRWPGPHWRGVLLTSPEAFVRDRLGGHGSFAEQVPTLFDDAHLLEAAATEVLSLRLVPAAWDILRDTFADSAEFWLDWRARLSRRLASQTARRLVLDAQLLAELGTSLAGRDLPEPWEAFVAALSAPARVSWVEFYRDSYQFSLVNSPVDIGPLLAEHLWPRQPTVIVGEALDPEREASGFRAHLGLGEMTCLRFPADAREQEVQLYLPAGLADPTSSRYLQDIEPVLVQLVAAASGPLVILLPEGPLRAHLGTFLAAQFGSRVDVERQQPGPLSVSLCSWEFWETHREAMELPTTLVVCSLPFPRLDDPLVAARVQWLKSRRRDWFREYLLPATYGRLQRGISPLRHTQGLVALLDNRINNRSYGHLLLDAITPARRLRYLE